MKTSKFTDEQIALEAVVGRFERATEGGRQHPPKMWPRVRREWDMGKLKGVGKVWQVTACDVASSYGVARILPELTAAAVATSCE